MGTRLVGSFDESCFEYTELDLENDIEEVTCILNSEEEFVDVTDFEAISETKESSVEKEEPNFDFITKLKEFKELLDENIITEEEFADIKAKLLAKM